MITSQIIISILGIRLYPCSWKCRGMHVITDEEINRSLSHFHVGVRGFFTYLAIE